MKTIALSKFRLLMPDITEPVTIEYRGRVIGTYRPLATPIEDPEGRTMTGTIDLGAVSDADLAWARQVLAEVER